MPDEQVLRRFTVPIVVYYDGSPNRSFECECTLTTARLLIEPQRGAMRQVPFSEILGVEPRTKLFEKVVRIELPNGALQLTCESRDKVRAVSSWLRDALAGRA